MIKDETYQCVAIIGASKSGHITAKNLKEAVEKAYDELETPSICHHCSSEIELGDVTGILAYQNGIQVFDDTIQTSKEKQISSLNEELDILNAQYVDRERVINIIFTELTTTNIAGLDALSIHRHLESAINQLPPANEPEPQNNEGDCVDNGPVTNPEMMSKSGSSEVGGS